MHVCNIFGHMQGSHVLISPGEGRGRRGGRRGGRFDGQGKSAQYQPYHGDNGSEEDLDDDNDVVMKEAENNRKRVSDLAVGKSVMPTGNHVTTSNGQQATLALPAPVVPPSPSSKQEPKRTKMQKDDGKSNVDKTGVQGKGDIILAGLEGRRRGQ